MSFLNGYKTYILAACAVIYAILGVVTGNLDSQAALGIVWAALSTAAIRHGVSTSSQ